MKKLIFTGVPALLALSCSSDDDNNAKVSVEGTWKLTKFETSEGIDFDNDGSASKNLITETNCFDNSTIVFGENDVVIFSMQSINAEPRENNGGGYNYNVTCNAATPSTGIYSVTSNSATINAGSEPIALTRSGNKLTLSIPRFSPCL